MAAIGSAFRMRLHQLPESWATFPGHPWEALICFTDVAHRVIRRLSWRRIRYGRCRAAKEAMDKVVALVHYGL